MRMLASAVAYLHTHKICHSDLKPDNVMVVCASQFTAPGVVAINLHLKLIDFGFAETTTAEGWATYQGRGSPLYMAPELLVRCGVGESYNALAADVRGHALLPQPHDPSVQVWSLGLVLLQLAAGYQPEGGSYGEGPQTVTELIVYLKANRSPYDVVRPTSAPFSDDVWRKFFNVVCFPWEPSERGSAAWIADLLQTVHHED
jgi:serine/threonine protein kinase